MKHTTKLQLRAALHKAGANKKEVYRILKIAESLGLKWSTRPMYGGGTEVSLFDKLDDIAVMSFYNNNFHIEFNDEYFDPGFKPTTYEDIRRAQIEAEERIYL